LLSFQLEDIFISLFQWAKVQPVIFPEQDPSSVLRRTSSSNRRTKADSSTPDLVPHIAGLLRPTLIICGITISPIKPSSEVSVKVYHQRHFISWLVGFWNALQDASQTTANSKSKTSWDKRSRVHVRSILQDYEQPFLDCLRSLTDATSTARGARIRTKRESSTPSRASLDQRKPRSKALPSLSKTQELLTRSAPTAANLAKRVQVHSPNSSFHNPLSSPHTPRGGILAKALGLNLTTENSSIWSPLKRSADPLPAKPLVKRRLFAGTMDQQEAAIKPEPKVRRKRRNSDTDTSELTGRSPVMADFEESAQSNYLPVTYTELDTSQQSWLIGPNGESDSQSASQSQMSQPSWDQFRDALRKRLSTDTLPTSVDHDEPQVSTQSPVHESSDAPPSMVVNESHQTTNAENPIILDGTNQLRLDEAVMDTNPPESETVDVTSATSENRPIENTTVKDNEADVVPIEVAGPNFSAEPTSVEPTDIPPATTTPPNTPQRLSTDDPGSENTTPKSYFQKFTNGLRTPVESNSPVPMMLSLNRPTSPLIRGIGSSRAQRMLALGLKKAAEQTARQKSNVDLPSSETNSPESVAPESPLTVRSTNVSDQTGSPSGIMRNLWSRKKPQRVSFAEQPVVFTFGRASQSPVGDSDSPQVTSEHQVSMKPVSALQDITGTTLNANSSDRAVIIKATIDESPPSQMPTGTNSDLKTKQMDVHVGNRRLSLPLVRRVDLDASQSSQEGYVLSHYLENLFFCLIFIQFNPFVLFFFTTNRP
uniref:Non-specific serine/threonine protein kinase n=1 Tax=Echinostoma caproni TaxID=27848 RepID=A0A183AZ91_9TREM